MERKMNRHKRRRANRQERKFLPKNCLVTEVDLTDPNLEPEHRNRFVNAIKGEVAQLDELIGRWYRRPECNVPDCDCGGNAIAKKAEMVCSHLWFIKNAFGEAVIDNYPHFGRFVKDYATEPGAYESLASSRHHQ
jgi:hypothetical protein